MAASMVQDVNSPSVMQASQSNSNNFRRNTLYNSMDRFNIYGMTQDH